jgi:hypothetical protein
MMAIKRKGIIAVPGEYKYEDDIEVKTAAELKAAAERQPIIMLTKGHPADGFPSSKDVIGTVSQKWNEEEERVDGSFWFHEEKIPNEIRDRINRQKPLPISPGFVVDRIGEKGEQEGIVYTHLAVLDGENARCPLGECGMNIRMDSEEGPRLVRFDQRKDLEAPEEPAKEEAAEPAEAEPEPEKTEEEPEISDSDEDEATTQQPSSEPVQENLEVAEPVEETPREPETVIPNSTSTVSALEEAGIRKVGNAYEYVPKIYRKKEDNE